MSYIEYADWPCCWRAVCNLLGTAVNISNYTEDEDNMPDTDFNLGTESLYCLYRQKEE
jgi:hypothetical protein